jgi:hypothetical protein
MEIVRNLYEAVSKSFRTGGLERGLQMIELCTTGCSCISILWVSMASFATIILCVASQRVFIFVRLYFVIDSVRELSDTPSYVRLGTFDVLRCVLVEMGR